MSSSNNQRAVRCFTRSLKNARFLQSEAPDLFAGAADSEGFGTGIPMEMLRGLHRTRHDSPALRGYQQVAEFLQRNTLPLPGAAARTSLFSGTIHFARLTFRTSGGDRSVALADMNQIVDYAQQAIVPISAYASQYGPNAVTIAPALLTMDVSVPSNTFTDGDLQGWVNTLVADNALPLDSCVFVVVPRGITAASVGDNAGYHSMANVPYVVAGVFGTNLTLTDQADAYAMVVSHEIAEMIVDPQVVGGSPEVCDPCDLNCRNLTRCYFDSTNTFAGSNQLTPPGGPAFAYYICGIVKPAAATACPPPSPDCQYAPG